MSCFLIDIAFSVRLDPSHQQLAGDYPQKVTNEQSKTKNEWCLVLWWAWTELFLARGRASRASDPHRLWFQHITLETTVEPQQ